MIRHHPALLRARHFWAENESRALGYARQRVQETKARLADAQAAYDAEVREYEALERQIRAEGHRR